MAPSSCPWSIWIVALLGKEWSALYPHRSGPVAGMDMYSLDKPSVITDLPAEPLAAAILARILR